ncbi:hypothetical protein GCM10009847_17540 [Leucobacter tardus]|uniref:M15 family metallopeptidase n=1 Tax=Leucobacter tardus TaxID=501483 RepID=A0A939TKX3_9MICO|nr:M15 family metallopeptidase [Leucobacter tardus]MBO2990731.1 M15 family metallopeptidase [Leucobacter tardus]
MSGESPLGSEHQRFTPPLPGSDLRRRPARRARRRRTLIVAGAVAGILVLGAGTASAVALTTGLIGGDDAATAEPSPSAPTPGATPPSTPTPEPTPTPTPTPTPEPTGAEAPEVDIDTADSITVVVNKQRPLTPIDWAPGDLVMPEGIPNTNGQPMRAEAAAALQTMYAEASAAGLPFTITSAYRPYDMQVGLFDDYAARDGVEAAETYSARAGHSEHQTGLAADLDDGSGCAFMACFGETATGQWLRDHAHEYGFILRYHDGAESIVGYIYEPWHFRYVGTDVAQGMHDAGEQNLETYLGLDPAPGY